MDNVFVVPPGWSWDIIVYFFFGGIAGGGYFIANVLRLVGGVSDRVLSRIAWYLAFPLIIVGALLLIKDLGRPERFLHMVFMSERIPTPIFKWWSPISFGTYIVMAFGAMTLLSFVHALVEGGVWRDHRVRHITSPLHDPGNGLGTLFLIGGGLWGLAVAAYTGMLLMISRAPTWAEDPFLAPMFMASAVANGAATIFLVAWLAGRGERSGLHRVLRMVTLALAFEFVLVVAAAISGLQHVSPFYLGAWGLLFWLVILPFGLVLPLVLLFHQVFRGRDLVPNSGMLATTLVLAGGFLLRALEVLGGQAYWVPY